MWKLSIEIVSKKKDDIVPELDKVIKHFKYSLLYFYIHLRNKSVRNFRHSHMK